MHKTKKSNSQKHSQVTTKSSSKLSQSTTNAPKPKSAISANCTISKSIFSRSLDTISPIWVKNGFDIAENYIGFSRKNLYRTALLGGFIGLQVLNSYYILQFFQAERSNFHKVLESEKYTAEEFNKAYFGVVQAIFMYIGSKVGSIALSELFINSVTIQMKKELAQDWIKSGAYNGINYLSKKDINPVLIVARDVDQFVSSTVTLLQDLIEKTAGFLLALASLSVLLNYELSFACLLLVGIIKLATSYCGHFVKDLYKKVNGFQGQEVSDFHDINKFSESIALSGGAAYEEAVLLGHIGAVLEYNNKSVLFNNINSFITALKGFGSWALGTYLCRDKLVDKAMNMGDAFTIGDSLEAFIAFVTWNDTHSTPIIAGQTAFERIQGLRAIITEWKTALIERDKHFTVSKTGEGDVAFSGVIKKPDGEVLFKGDLSFQAGKAYQLIGPSGIGKSSIIRALAGLWPYVEGTLTMPENVHIIPQVSYVKGGDTSLLDIIRYPRTDTPTEEEIMEIQGLMKDLGFAADSDKFVHLGDREWQDNAGETVKAQWSFSLSGGEKQRIAIMSAIIKQPKFLVMDEATSAIDHDLKILVESNLKKHLPASCILFVDHNPSGLFDDNLRQESFIKSKDVDKMKSALHKQPRFIITNQTPLDSTTMAKINAKIQKIVPGASVLEVNGKRFADNVINVADYQLLKV